MIGGAGIRPAVVRERVDVGAARIYYQHVGVGRPVVLIHGLSGSGHWWSKNVAVLASRFHVYVVDLIGFGRSARRGRFLLAEAASCLTQWLDRLEISRASFVGHSMGGYIAAELAANDPNRIDRLVLVDAAIELPRRGRLAYTGALIRSARITPLRFLPILAADAYRAGPRAIWNAAGELLTGDLGEKLPAIHSPVLVVWGERDLLLPMEVGSQLVKRLPTARLVVIPGAGHNSMWDRPEDFNRLVVEFLGGECSARTDGERLD